jgi:hypothetical protein
MERNLAFIFGMGTAVLWLAGWGDPQVSSYIPWGDFLCAVSALAYSFSNERNLRTRGVPLVIGLILTALWIAGLGSRSASWIVWWNFTFACLFILLGAGALARKRYPARRDEDQEKRRAG